MHGNIFQYVSEVRPVSPVGVLDLSSEVQLIELTWIFFFIQVVFKIQCTYLHILHILLVR